jgi:hypothetical protein
MKQKLRKILFGSLLFSLIVIFAIGLIFTTEIIWRALGPVASRSTLVDVGIFPYKDYVVTSQPANLEVGNGDHVLENFFPKGSCAIENGVTARFNSDGFRTHELSTLPNKAADEIRIIITGGSASVSWNIGEACTLDNHLYRLFAEHYPNKKVRIFNLGSAAWKSFQELIAIQLYGLRLQPDLIVSFDGFNDIQHSYSMAIDRPYTNIVEKAFARYQSWVEGGVNELFQNLKVIDAIKQPSKIAVGMVKSSKTVLNVAPPELAQSAEFGKLATNMHYPLDLKAVMQRTDFDPYNKKVVDNYLKNEMLMAKAAEMVGAKMLVVMQPILYLKTSLSETERKTLDSYAESVNFAVQGYLRMNLGLREVASKQQNLTFVDMSNVFVNNDQTLFTDYCHFKKEGYEIVANKLFNEITKVLALQQ